ncbi:hypothetical protein CQW23_03818 [Capsicum baccatum]|uniref:Serine-threonine/tyrosine-protein kinase catalytic domain-containing protein n=1 Tax=Capsicum baccatum TaxID=33114 RepID=A0A2G2XCU9_CAPBA|nr:hypothetical protein CQW23_03818 [Capsicum baccatum]
MGLRSHQLSNHMHRLSEFSIRDFTLGRLSTVPKLILIIRFSIRISLETTTGSSHAFIVLGFSSRLGPWLGAGETFVQTRTIATIRYIAPECGQEGIVSTSWDVYSFGNMIMEMFTRIRPGDEIFTGDLSIRRWVTIPIPVHRNSSYDEFIASVMQSGDLDCASSDVVISYVMHLRKKLNPTITNSNVRVLTYIMDADADGFRPILRINVVERSFEGPLNSSAPPPRCPTVDDDLINDGLNDMRTISMIQLIWKIILCI